MYKLKYSTAAAKYIKKIKNNELKSELKKAIDSIAQNPLIGEAKMGDLQGIFGYDVFYDSVNYEIAYTVLEKEVLITIIMVGTRENFYKELKRYIKSAK